MKSRISTFLIVIVLLTGIGLMLYPFVSDRVITFLNERAIERNGEALRAMEALEKSRLLKRAREYNENLNGGIRDAFSGDSAEDDAYMSLLNPSGDGMMGSIAIPKIGVEIPIYHTTQSDVLHRGVGHVYSTALPVGGEGTHCALAGHRGLPGARLFTDLPKMEIGDLFTLHVAGETLTYEVDQIVTVEPAETQWLNPEPGRDLVTLVTCTPYGVNTHRLLVRGTRIESPPPAETETAAYPQWLPYGACGAVIAVLTVFFMARRKKRRALEHKDPDQKQGEVVEGEKNE